MFSFFTSSERRLSVSVRQEDYSKTTVPVSSIIPDNGGGL